MNARTSNAVSASGEQGPTTPTLGAWTRAARSGSTARTASASRSSTANHPGPLSAYCASPTSVRDSRNPASARFRSAPSTGPLRSRGGAANASRCPRPRSWTSPAAHCWTGSSSRCGTPPASSHARAARPELVGEHIDLGERQHPPALPREAPDRVRRPDPFSVDQPSRRRFARAAARSAGRCLTTKVVRRMFDRM